MKQFAKLMLLTLGFGLLAALTGLVGPQPKSTNAAVAAAVNVVNTPGVNANQSGPWNVGINGTPDVNVVNTPTVNLAPNTTVGITGGNFNFSNTAQTPIFTRDKDNAALTPFQTVLCAGAGTFTACADKPFAYGVPNGARAVVEFVSQECDGSGGWSVGDLRLSTSVGTAFVPFPLLPAQTDPFSGLRIGVMQTRIYADPGTSIFLTSSIQGGTPGGFAHCNVSLSGYLVSVP